MLGREEMIELVREDFKKEAKRFGVNCLVGFLEVENTIDSDYPSDFTQAGATLVYYVSNTGEITCELLDDMVGELASMIKKNVIIPGAEARRLAETLVEEDTDIFEVMSGLELLGIPSILAQAIVESVLPLDDDEDNVFEEFFNLLNEYTTIQW